MACFVCFDEQFLAAHPEFSEYFRRVYIPRSVPETFSLHSFDPIYFQKLFRFTQNELLAILPFLRLPSRIKEPRAGYNRPVEDALCMFLGRLSVPLRVRDFVPIFRVSQAQISLVSNFVARLLNERWERKIRFNESFLMDSHRMLRYARQVSIYVSHPGALHPLFIDGSGCEIRRPEGGIHVPFFSGHHRAYELRALHVVGPDGICHMTTDMYPGSYCDAGVFMDENMETDFQRFLDPVNDLMVDDLFERRVTVYGDSGFGRTMNLTTPFHAPTEEERAMNRAMSSARIVVENFFGRMKTLWKFCVQTTGHEIQLSPVGLYYKMAVFFTNIYNCIHTDIAERFFITPPTLDEYLA